MKKKEILIVDNELDFRRLLEKTLSGAGYFVIEASNARDAIIIAKERCPDLIILDILLPDMNGGQVEEILRNDPITRNIPIIFLTGLLTKEEAKERSMAGSTCFIAKPYKRAELLKEIDNYF